MIGIMLNNVRYIRRNMVVKSMLDDSMKSEEDYAA